MADHAQDQARQAMNERSTDELHAIWIENDKGAWSQQAIDTAREVLLSRGEEIRHQNPAAEADPYKDFPTKISLVRVWRGEAELGEVYWLYGILVGLCVFVIDIGSGWAIFGGILTYESAGLLQISIRVIVMLYMLFFWSFAVWRSAKKYSGKKIWAILANFHVLLIWASAAWLSTILIPIISSF